MKRVMELTLIGPPQSGKSEAALGFALFAARRGPVLFVCDNEAAAKVRRQQLQMESGGREIVFCGLGKLSLVNTFTTPFQTVVVDAEPDTAMRAAILAQAERAAALHGRAWLVAVQRVPS